MSFINQSIILFICIQRQYDKRHYCLFPKYNKYKMQILSYFTFFKIFHTISTLPLGFFVCPHYLGLMSGNFVAGGLASKICRFSALSGGWRLPVTTAKWKQVSVKSTRRSQAKWFFLLQKNREMKAGERKIHSTKPGQFTSCDFTKFSKQVLANFISISGKLNVF